jgi:hypothetical protein
LIRIHIGVHIGIHIGIHIRIHIGVHVWIGHVVMMLIGPIKTTGKTLIVVREVTWWMIYKLIFMGLDE